MPQSTGTGKQAKPKSCYISVQSPSVPHSGSLKIARQIRLAWDDLQAGERVVCSGVGMTQAEAECVPQQAGA